MDREIDTAKVEILKPIPHFINTLGHISADLCGGMGRYFSEGKERVKMKQVMNTRELLKKILPIFLIVVLLSGCTAGTELEQDSNAHIPPVNEDGLIVIQIPKTLLGGYTAEELEAEDIASRKDPDEQDQDDPAWTALVANEDGTVSYYFTPEQYQDTKDCYYDLGCLRDEQTSKLSYSFVESAEYTDLDANGIPRGLVVSVIGDAYHSNELWNSALVAVAPAIMLGRYQILCGISGDEWSVHITVKDAETDEVISETDFPTRDSAQ